jgi:hypothetical protein
LKLKAVSWLLDADELSLPGKRVGDTRVIARIDERR